MNENQKSVEVLKNPGSQNNQDRSKTNSSTSEKPPVTAEDEEKQEGDEFIREGHGHDYSTPVAGEDGGTEDQSESESEKSTVNSDKSENLNRGINKGESATI